MSVIRAKTAELIAFVTSPVTWVKSLMFLEEENRLLREKNLSLTLQVESMLNLEKENQERNQMMNFKSNTNL